MIIKKKITVMIQTRTGSNRFPRKVLQKIENKTMISRVIERVKQIKSVQQIALITTNEKSDKILLDIANEEGIIGFVGDTQNVLNRHYECALKINADPIIRITGDCPLLDPKISSEILNHYINNDFDYVSNTINPTFPDGLDTEVFSFAALQKAADSAKLDSEREHVTPYIIKNPRFFKLFNYEYKKDLSNFRFTVDQKEDLEFVRKIYALMKPRTIFSMEDILKEIIKNPTILNINKNIKRNEGYKKSLENDHEII